ncbi:FkbM family methyltransferase [Thiopseudomonas denitrificans]|uniref:FkbM family methyltransferase n=1 Tax=Thiopseudomonas denitrificans TaxID=1501432 RepID=A0A4R6TTR6_9GAMM|nr:FkbM family methyltransferase [Thiopseudomonas denitrificans]TDQ36701.1 FkbM family methyltransferase [Thiopseudomonas denitrificans]
MQNNSFLQHLEAKKEKLDEKDKHLYEEKIEKYNKHLDSITKNLYKKLSPTEQERLVIWFMKRWLSIDIISISEKAEYQAKLKEVASQKTEQFILNGKQYHTLDLKKANLTGKLTTYKWNFCVHDFNYRQYEHNKVKHLENSFIIDAGAFVGDTAVLFSQTYINPTIHSFELLDENIELLEKNIKDNNIQNTSIYKTALSDKDGDIVHIKATAIQGATSMFGENTGEAIETITIDKHIKDNNIAKVDFIKMDIEGAERYALAGATNTIKKHKPTLAICIYHLWDDIIKLPELISCLNPSYKLAFNWVELNNGWEAVLFAFE